MEESMDVNYTATDISYAASKLSELTSQWDSRVKNEISYYRSKRFQKVDVEAARREQTLLSDETFIDVRAIETAISRTKPAYLNYLKSPTNLVVFVKPEQPASSFEDVEIAFDRSLKYPSWDEPHIQCIDCMLAHGFGGIEVLYDETAPGHVSLEYVAKEDIIFHLDTEDIQQQQYVMRRYCWTKLALKTHAKTFGFDIETVEDLCCKLENTNSVDVFKVYIKTPEGLYIAWWADKMSDKWLKDPIPYTVGFLEPETYIPLFILRKDLLEDKKLLSIKGLCFLQHSTQQAVSAIYSGVINGVLRASNPIFSPKGTADMGTQEPVMMKAGYVAKRELNMHFLAYPSSELLMSADNLRRMSMEDLGHTNYAVEASQSTRKTATEIASANATQANLNSVSVTNLSTFLGNIYTYAWRIVQNEALNDRIVFLGERNAFGQFVNNKQRISGRFLIFPAGDREYLRRKEVEQALGQFLPLVQGTPLAKVIVADALTYALPNLGQRYKAVYLDSIQAQDLTLNLMQGFIQRIQQGIDPTGQISTVQYTTQELQQLMQMYAQYQRIYGVSQGDDAGMAETPNNNEAPANSATA